MARKKTYHLPYDGILGTPEQTALEDSMRELCKDFELYDERVFLNTPFKEKLTALVGENPPIVQTRELLRKDLAHNFPEIPEAWFWIFFSRQLWGFELEVDTYYEIKWWIWLEHRGKMQCVNQWGSQNSGKTFFSGRFPVVQLLVWDADCIGFISGPYKTHSTDKTWKEVKAACRAVKFDTKAVFGVDFKITRDEVSATSEAGIGFIKFVAAQEASSVQGGKSTEHQEDGRRGISFFFVDEFIENPYMDLAESFGNYRSNFNSYTVLACNPKPDKIQAPALISFADPIDIKRTQLRKTKHFRWRTRKGTCVRFCWLNCPNRILNRTKFPYLMNEARKETQALEEEHIKAAQLDAWGWGAEGASTLTDAQRQIAAGVFSEFYFEHAAHGRYMAVDPAFGGEDPAVYTILDAAKINIEGTPQTRFVAAEQNYIHGIEADFIADADFVNKVRRIIQYRHSVGDRSTKFLEEIQMGSTIGAMAQGAVLAAEIAIEKNVPFTQVTFDASQRADCYDWMVKAFGHDSLTWWYEGSRRLIQEEGDDWYRWPYRTHEDRKGSRHEKWSDYCGRTITMIWAFACELINNKYLINGDKVQKGLDELGAREVASTSSGKVDVWSKADIKRGTFQGKKIPKMSSPAWGETLSICLYFATRFHNAVNLGDKPELSMHIGSNQTDDDEWLELAEMY